MKVTWQLNSTNLVIEKSGLRIYELRTVSSLYIYIQFVTNRFDYWVSPNFYPNHSFACIYWYIQSYLLYYTSLAGEALELDM